MSEQFGKVTALLFYPKNETLVCTKQMCSIRDHWADYLQTKASIVGISPDKADENLDFSKNYGLPLPILADTDRKVTEIYGSHRLLPIQFMRAIVIIDARGFIRHRKVMLRIFRPTDRSVIASIYAARTDFMGEHYSYLLSEAKERNKNLLH
ncbi:MAG: peroxiredoxin [Pyrinomonadaceae bacterium]|nr:peroxiredoxin [Pyrinomonadaceae bacterium]